MKRYDAVIVGAGVTGCAVARELSRREGSFLVVEKEPDVCEGTSKANSAIIHAGFDAEPGSWKAKMNVRGNTMMDKLSEELDIPFQRTGALVVCGALLAETSGIVCPFELTLGLGENAAQNGVEFRFNTQVLSLEKTENGWLLHTGEGDVEARAVVNAAGVSADKLHNMACEEKLHITARRGEYMLLDKSAGGHVSRTIFQLPGKYGKGVLVSPTVHGNLLVGPTAADTEEKENTATTAQGLAEVMEKSALAVNRLPLRQVITSFSGLRAHEEGDDFVLGESAPGFFDAAGIESPGLTSAPAIGEYLAAQIAEKLGLSEKKNFIPVRRGVLRIAALPLEERIQKIRENPAYGAIVCRCEEISEGEILDAIHSTLGARTLDGVKRRTRAGMGRCQSGFCSPRVMELLSGECEIPLEKICKSGKASGIVSEKIR